MTEGTGVCPQGEVAAETSAWFAVRVRSNFERFGHQILLDKGIRSFLPTYQLRRQWSDRVREVEFPLFPGYLFCHIEAHQRVPVLSTTGVVGLVGVGNTPVPIPAAEIEAIRVMVDSQLPLRAHPFLQVGQTVRILHGPLTGLEGVLLKMKSRYRFVVSITLLQRSIAAEIDSCWVTPVN